MLYNDYEVELKNKGYVSFNPRGESMWPFIKNAKCTVVLQKEATFSPYDVVLYKNNGAYSLHRIIEDNGEALVVCGDGQLVLETIRRDSVLAVMTELYVEDKSINLTCERYKSKIKKYYDRKSLRKLRIKLHVFKCKLKYKIRHAFGKKGK